jgi:hypothetical protein
LYGEREILGERHARGRKKGKSEGKKKQTIETQINTFYTVNTLENINMTLW